MRPVKSTIDAGQPLGHLAGDFTLRQRCRQSAPAPAQYQIRRDERMVGGRQKPGVEDGEPLRQHADRVRVELLNGGACIDQCRHAQQQLFQGLLVG